MNTDKFKGDENPFKVPEGYFENSRARIMAAIAEEKPSEPVRKINFKSNLYWISGVAASLIIGFVLFQNLYLNPLKDNRMAQEINWFVNYAGSELNSDMLASYVAEEGMEVNVFFEDADDSEQYNLLEVGEIDESFIIEQMMKSENW